jgi:hypothetical protein
MFLYSTVSTLKPEEFDREKRAFHSRLRGIDVSLPGEISDAKLTDGRDGGHDFAQLQLVEDGGFSSSVQTD